MKYTLAVTSCNRFDLLKRTLDSFLSCADVLPERTVLVDDSDQPKPAWTDEPKYRALGNDSKWLSNGRRRGQLYTLDRLYDEVDTEYVFHLEDDWAFTRGDFIRRSFEILLLASSISAVSLRGDDCNGHPNTPANGYPFAIQSPGWQGGWGGYSFNPGLRRLSDLRHFGGSFGRIVGYGKNGCAPELTLSRVMLDKGYRIAVLDREPHVKHIGNGVSRAIESLPPLPRVLLAVPVTHKYEYGNLTSGIDRVTDGRIEAVRATWWKDTAAHSNLTARFFYGRPEREGKPDEVFLDCPDDYVHLPQKTKAICQYALDHGYDFLIKCDDDTAVYVDRLMRCGFDAVDYMGGFCKHTHKCFCYATGMCYTLAWKAMTLVADAPFTPVSEPCSHAEDLWVGRTLRAAGIRPVAHPGWTYNPNSHYVNFPLPRRAVIAHSVRPADMRKWYAEAR